MEVQRNEDGRFGINQRAYIMKIVNDYGLADAKSSDEKYRKLIGRLLYVSVNARPDIAASVAILGEKVEKPTQTDWDELKRVVEYLKGTANLSLIIGITIKVV